MFFTCVTFDFYTISCLPARKLQLPGATDLASKGQSGLDINDVKPKEEVDDSFQAVLKIRCPCGRSLATESMIQVRPCLLSCCGKFLYILQICVCSR